MMNFARELDLVEIKIDTGCNKYFDWFWEIYKRDYLAFVVKVFIKLKLSNTEAVNQFHSESVSFSMSPKRHGIMNINAIKISKNTYKINKRGDII